MIYSDDHIRLSSIVRRERKKNKITQKQLAESIGKSQSFVAKLETGQQRFEVLEFKRICELIGHRPSLVFEELDSWSNSSEKRSLDDKQTHESINTN